MSGPHLSNQRSDRDLVATCNQGDAAAATKAFEILYRRHKDYVIRVALRYVPDNDSALDVLQETFSYLLRKFPPSGTGLTLTANLTTLLFPVAKNNAISLLRKTSRFPPSVNVTPDDLEGPDTAQVSSIEPLLRDLSDERREVLTLRFVDDMTLQDIATTLQIPLGTVKSRLHLAVKQLRESPESRKFLDP